MSWKEPILDWRTKYKTLDEYYNNEYPSKYFEFSKYERQIDPTDSIEDVNDYSPEMQQREMLKCAISFTYWCHKYVKITHPTRGLLPFILFKYQKRCIEEYEKHRYNILSKFRQGGLTTVTTIWCLWRCLFKLDETIMVVSKSDREAIAAGEIVKRALEELPIWMQPEMSKNNDHQKIFMDTGCKLFFYTPEAARGRSITYLILDEAAFVPQMDKHWKAMFPTLSNGGHCICISTVNGVGNWYYDVFQGAKRKSGLGSDFNVIELDYNNHPDYDDPEWVRSMRAQLGEKGWLQEVMRDFLGAGESYIPPEIIAKYTNQVKDIRPLRKLFGKWNNLDEVAEASTDRTINIEEWERGALWIWREPIDGREYIIGVDGAEGMGEENDNSCFEVIDQVTCEQVAEFYSNECPSHEFSQILAMVGKTYNNAMIVVESQSTGLTIIDKLQHEFFYDNLFESPASGKRIQIGVKTSQSSRNKFLESMQTRMLNDSMAVRSPRLVKELKGFIWNTQGKKAEAAKGFHDDAIMALCFALYARDQRVRQVPAGYSVGQEEPELTESFRAEIMAQVKDELSRQAPDDWLDPDMRDMQSILDMMETDYTPVAPSTTTKRSHHRLLLEFGW